MNTTLLFGPKYCYRFGPFWEQLLFSIFLLSYSFVQFDLITMLIFIYALCFYGFLFLFLIFSTSSVTYCANKTYKTLNSLIISYSKHNENRYYRRTSSKLKVFFNIIHQYSIKYIFNSSSFAHLLKELH